MFQSAGSTLKGLSTRLIKLRSPVRQLKVQMLGTVDELGTSKSGAEVTGVALEAPNVSARGADDTNRGDEVAQRDFSDAESISDVEMREPRRRNSPSDPTSRGDRGSRADR